jgi:hypothetical protein
MQPLLLEIEFDFFVVNSIPRLLSCHCLYTMYTRFAQTATRFGFRFCSSSAAPETPVVQPLQPLQPLPQQRPTFGENLGQFVSRHPFITLGFAWWLGYGSGCRGRPLISLVHGGEQENGAADKMDQLLESAINAIIRDRAGSVWITNKMTGRKHKIEWRLVDPQAPVKLD